MPAIADFRVPRLGNQQESPTERSFRHETRRAGYSSLPSSSHRDPAPPSEPDDMQPRRSPSQLKFLQYPHCQGTPKGLYLEDGMNSGVKGSNAQLQQSRYNWAHNRVMPDSIARKNNGGRKTDGGDQEAQRTDPTYQSNIDPNGDEGVQMNIQTPESRRCLGSTYARRRTQQFKESERHGERRWCKKPATKLAYVFSEHTVGIAK